ncbi:MAG: DNA methyltransferase, partial [Chloroflexi bacterium]|nr:DNA methyltransferase [Chloroflexota bacterium]
PQQLVAAQVRLAADVLANCFGCSAGFGDHRVLLVDPAAGAGVYPLAAMADTAERCCAAAPRIVAFEARPGAATLVRARLSRAGAHEVDVRVEDTLGAELQGSAPILVCMGNPPYRRGRALEATFATHTGVHGKNLHNAYVYFWRWALRTVFQQREGAGLVSLVTPASFLAGPGFGGLRALLRQELDELWVLDLGGDGRGARPSDNVFEIRSPVAVTMGVRFGCASPDPARVWFARLDGTRAEKLDALDRVRVVRDIAWREVDGGPQAAFVGRRVTRYHSWPLLTELFPLQLSGCQMKRTWPVAPTRAAVLQRWQTLLEFEGADRERAFQVTRDRSCASTPPGLFDGAPRQPALATLETGGAPPQVVRYAYRSFDRQWLLADSRLGDFMRPRLWRMAGPRQIFLTSLLTGVLGDGPAAVATALVPDLDHFRGSFGGRAVIPLWLDFEGTQPNVDARACDVLSDRLGIAVSPEDLLAYCYALLSSSAYARRFHEELLEPGPRVPVDVSVTAFARGVELGRELLWFHTFGTRILAGRALHGRAACIVAPSQPTCFRYDEGEQRLHLGNGMFGPVEPGLWSFGVSGLRVLPSWLGYRTLPAKHPSLLDDIRPVWTEAATHELLELLWVLEGTLALQPELETLLDEVVA